MWCQVGLQSAIFVNKLYTKLKKHFVKSFKDIQYGVVEGKNVPLEWLKDKYPTGQVDGITGLKSDGAVVAVGNNNRGRLNGISFSAGNIPEGASFDPAAATFILVAVTICDFSTAPKRQAPGGKNQAAKFQTPVAPRQATAIRRDTFTIN
ncbi:MAG: hypothetical protein GY850_05250 [bacterium]|nr:hypothetical protein [bacterium]